MRLVTRADFDGLVCGALITQFETIDSYLFVEPKFMQDGMVEIRRGDIIANLPYTTSPTRRRIFPNRSCPAKVAFAWRPAPPAWFASTTLKQFKWLAPTVRRSSHF